MPVRNALDGAEFTQEFACTCNINKFHLGVFSRQNNAPGPAFRAVRVAALRSDGWVRFSLSLPECRCQDLGRSRPGSLA